MKKQLSMFVMGIGVFGGMFVFGEEHPLIHCRKEARKQNPATEGDFHKLVRECMHPNEAPEAASTPSSQPVTQAHATPAQEFLSSAPPVTQAPAASSKPALEVASTPAQGVPAPAPAAAIPAKPFIPIAGQCMTYEGPCGVLLPRTQCQAVKIAGAPQFPLGPYTHHSAYDNPAYEQNVPNAGGLVQGLTCWQANPEMQSAPTT